MTHDFGEESVRDTRRDIASGIAGEVAVQVAPGGQVAREKVAEPPLPDEADPGAVLFLVVGEPGLAGWEVRLVDGATSISAFTDLNGDGDTQDADAEFMGELFDETLLRTLANDVCSAINEAGDI